MDMGGEWRYESRGGRGQEGGTQAKNRVRKVIEDERKR